MVYISKKPDNETTTVGKLMPELTLTSNSRRSGLKAILVA
jgi:hypothetical protein